MKARQIAMGGIFAALALVILLLGGIIPVGTYIAPMLASLPLVVLLAELPKKLCLGWYAIVAFLAVLLCPDKETAFVFVFLGWYPLAKPGLDRLPKLPGLVCKLLIFNAATAALYALLILVFRLEALVQEAKETGLVMLIVLLLLANVCFLLLDFLLARLTLLYRIKRKK
ncbi:MAG: hypothetical protein J5789_01145 [Oscillospiraceae bacterium]|nr:hypothetical protein [Oscillospiraceae bacterium]